MDAIWGALAQAVPDSVPADGEGGNTIIAIGGYDSMRRAFAFVDLFCGARGARPSGDGPDGVPHPGSNISNTPVEIAEVEHPVRIERYGLLRDSGGVGEYRGALSHVREVRSLVDEATLQLRSDKRAFPPFGLHGGKPGTPSTNVLNPGSDGTMLPTMGAAPMRRGDLIRHVMASGGGWGDPLDRDPERVALDVLDDKVSLAHAKSEYGVIIDPESLEVDWEATEQTRHERRQPS
jgi:N-methylhydantoinase B